MTESMLHATSHFDTTARICQTLQQQQSYAMKFVIKCAKFNDAKTCASASERLRAELTSTMARQVDCTRCRTRFKAVTVECDCDQREWSEQAWGES